MTHTTYCVLLERIRINHSFSREKGVKARESKLERLTHRPDAG